MNSVCLMGRIGRDLELKTTTTGKSVLSFPIGVQNMSKDKDKNTDWIDCVAWGTTAEFINTYFGKGSLIAITGRLTSRMWEDKNGATRKATEVVINEANFTGEKSSNSGSHSSSGGSTTSNQRGSGNPVEVAPPDDFVEMADDSELPF